ncbi:MAG: glycoside hydrolase family 3 N-terminal domain-containing protein [Eubacteriales bacterium]|uniref:glycoside hydrolase family 3 N-terminal domain-containing protein n=1 Tax=Fenollaria sp. TaxID=1965292 RepID=UPI002A764915|nr:glycoside hydrolase family 3 N-terminal domain-containing protein [Fenollaria sp.]MDD7340005.1 glycoside hydrolase family 3 N-terminal domain-containing protein [Eubacteriales bacterium]MDY3105471.1 glycoside hydrolase family 3 N-terminal domain-containing protein [Fenollaria sp.]
MKKKILLTLFIIMSMTVFVTCKAKNDANLQNEAKVNNEAKMNGEAKVNDKAKINDKAKPIEEKKLTEKTKEEKILEKMSLDEKIGQIFIARCPDKDAAALAKKYNLGGYILFGRDFKGKTKDAVVKNIKSYQNASAIPMFIAVDEEGGTVNRVSTNKNFRKYPFASPQYLYKHGGMDRIKSDAKEKSELLKSIGINLNFAPVADISTNKNDFIYKRSFAKSPQETAEYVKSVVDVMNEARVGSVLKHFPGYGNNKDTHTDLVHDKRPMAKFEKEDFLPFKAGIDAKASMVLVSHNIVEAMDKNSPASISPAVHKILRDELAFDGVIITDDLAMQGVKKFVGEKNAAVLALKAGADMLCSTDFINDIAAVKAAVTNSEIKETDIDEHVLRVLRAKINLEIIK